MDLKVKFTVLSVRHSVFKNAPIEWDMEQISDPRPLTLKPSTMTFDDQTALDLGLPTGTSVVGRNIVLKFTSHHLGPIIAGDDIDWNQAPRYFLRLESLEKHETIEPDTGHTDIQMLMRLVSPGGGDGIHPSIPPCPFFTFHLALTGNMFELAKQLRRTTVFVPKLEYIYDV